MKYINGETIHPLNNDYSRKMNKAGLPNLYIFLGRQPNSKKHNELEPGKIYIVEGHLIRKSNRRIPCYYVNGYALSVSLFRYLTDTELRQYKINKILNEI